MPVRGHPLRAVTSFQEEGVFKERDSWISIRCSLRCVCEKDRAWAHRFGGFTIEGDRLKMYFEEPSVMALPCGIFLSPVTSVCCAEVGYDNEHFILMTETTNLKQSVHHERVDFFRTSKTEKNIVIYLFLLNRS